MGVTIKAVTDGFRRGGIAHRAEGTYYPDGFFTERQLEEFRREPQLVVVEGAEFVLSDDKDDASLELVQELGSTIASLEYQLAAAEDGRQLVVAQLSVVIEQLPILGESIIREIRELPAQDAAAEGVVCVSTEAIEGIVQRYFQKVSDQSKGFINASEPASSGSDAPSVASAPAPVPAPSGADKPVGSSAKPARGGRRAAEEQKGND